MDQNETAPATEPEAKHLVESRRPLSSSLLWRLQRQFFEQAGVEAWSEGIVPMYVTSNPFIARAYARVVAAYLREWATPSASTDTAPIRRDEPVYIVELAAGSGRFAFNFLRQLLESRADAEADGLRTTYVMTEYNPALIEFWQEHSALQPFIAAGQLDFAHFDANRPAELRLMHSGIVLAPGGVANPLVLLGNYFFDSIPQDIFYIENGLLYESQVALYSTQPEADQSDPAVLERLKLVYHRQPLAGDYYGDPEWDAMLDAYRQILEATAVPFPSIGLGCVRYFNQLSGERLLLVSSDKGYHRIEELHGRHEPGIEVHGSFSMGVNYHAIGEYFRRHDGSALHHPYRHTYLDTSAFLLGELPAGGHAVRRAYEEAVGAFGPEDFFLLQSDFEKHVDGVSIETAMAMLRLSAYDPRVFQKCFPGIFANLASASELMKEELRRAVDLVWAAHYHIGEEYDLPYDLGVLLYKLGDYAVALRLFAESLALHGDGPKAYYNMGLCHYCRQEFGAALRCMLEAEKCDPEFAPAINMRRRLLSELDGQAG